MSAQQGAGAVQHDRHRSSTTTTRRSRPSFLPVALLLVILAPQVGPAPARATPVTGVAAGAARAQAPGRVMTGAEVLVEDGAALLAGQKVGVVTNPTGVLPDLRHLVDVLHGMPAVNVVAVFGPEHGFRGTAPAGQSEGSFTDPATGLPVYDTYGKRGRELAGILTRSGADTVVFDIQDVGTRFYTYIWTMLDSMEAAAVAGKRFVVLDRPNPVTGVGAEGPVLEPAFASFVGRQPVAQRHGMTVGELALLFNAEFLPRTVGRPVDLEVVELRGWRRGMWWDETGLPWVPPSPNMPTPDTALVYPGTGMLEGTNLSEGRGTTRPFELLGAPWIDGRLAAALTAAALPGVRFREAYFQPATSKHAGETAGGVQVHVTDRDAFDPILTALTVIAETRRLYPDRFAWREDRWIDKLTGSGQVRTMVDAGAGPAEIAAAWEPDLAGFRDLRARHLLYAQDDS